MCPPGSPILAGRQGTSVPLSRYELWSGKVNMGGAVKGQSFNFPIKRPKIGGAPSPKFGVIGRASRGARIPAMKRRNLTKVIFEVHWK